LLFSIIRAGIAIFPRLSSACPMKFWPILTLVLLFERSALLGQVENALLQKGSDALSSGLWEAAELHFRQALAEPKISAELRSLVAVRLAETLIREGNTTEALDLLSQSFASSQPEAAFWQAQALALQGRFAEAIGCFSTQLANPELPYRLESGLTQASLQLAIGQEQAALDTLASLIPGANPADLTQIKLRQVEILLDLGRIPEARAALPPAQGIPANGLNHAAFLEAQLQLRENRPAEAEIAFQALVNHPQDQAPARYAAAALGLADAIHAQGRSEQATLSLLAFLQDRPQSAALEAVFQRLLQWLPDKPALTDPILERSAQWITPPALRPFGLIADPSGLESAAPAAWPADPLESDVRNLLAYSLYTRAIGLHRIGTAEAKTESRLLLNRLRLENPQHPLANRALYQLATWCLQEGANERALAILEILHASMPASPLKGEAVFLEARVNLIRGDLGKTISLFDEAARFLAESDARLARKHAAVLRFRSGGQGSVLIQQQGLANDPALEADIQLEQALASTPPGAAKTALEKFITDHPEHPRTPEARLAALEAALAGPGPDLTFARAQLDALTTKTDLAPGIPPVRLAYARLLIAERSNEPAATIAAAQFILDSYPADPVAADAALTLGRCLFQNGDYNPARLVLEKLAAADTDPARTQVAWLLAARSAALGGTPQSKEQALILFDHAIDGSGPLTAVATLEKAGHLIEMYRLSEASAFLAAWIKTLAKDDPLQLPAGLLLGEALYAQGATNPASLLEALAVYDQLLVHSKSQPALFNRLQYLRGITLEQLPDEKEPAKKREKEAFQAFLSVLDTTTPPLEWEYFERCGFRALTYLEKDESRLQTAITIAKKIASFRGPRAAEADARANNLQLIAPWVD
jgi:thioredoxin-like negative regulator of GroEL